MVDGCLGVPAGAIADGPDLMARVASRWTGHLTQERPLERGARAEDVEATRVSLIQRWPIYSSPIVVAALLALYSGATATAESLPRPLLIALVAAVVIQLALSALFRSRHMGAYATLCLGLFVLDWPIIGAILAAVPLTVALSARIVRRARSNSRDTAHCRRSRCFRHRSTDRMSSKTEARR